MKTMIKNYIFNMGYQILVIGASLILAPYLSRVIGAKGIGIYSYTYSIASMFGILAHLGIAKYGNREIAKCEDDRQKRSEVFAQIQYIKLLSAMIVLFLYGVFLRFMVHEYEAAFRWQIFLILSYIFDVTWVFWGMQQFQFTTVICSIVKILSVLAVLFFVRSSQDVNLYIFFMSFSFFLIQLIPWFFLSRFVDLKISSNYALKTHGKSILLLFFPVLARQIYGIMDTVMLRHFTDMEQVGYYQNTGGITFVVVCVITALGDVIMPKITIYLHENRSREVSLLFCTSFHLISFLGVGSMYGLMGISETFIPFFYGEGFRICSYLLQLLAPIVLITGYSELIRSSFLIPNYQDREYVFSLTAGVLVNFLGNYILIQLIGTPGAILASVCSELTALLLQLYFARTSFPFSYCLKEGIIYLFLGLPILFVCKLIHIFHLPYSWTTGIDIFLGGGIYVICVMLYLKKTKPEIYNRIFKLIKKEL